MSSKPKPPARLRAPGQALWFEVVAKYTLRADELRALEDACAATDLLDDLETAWVELGRPFITKGSMGQEVEHPLIGSMDKQRKSRQAFLKQLRLPDENGDAAGDRSAAARAAANARWSRRGA